MSSPDDVLTAQSVVLGILTALYGFWKPDFDRAKSLQPRSQRKSDNTDLTAEIKGQLWPRAVPLTVYSLVLALIFVPSSAGVLGSAFGCGKGCGFDEIAASSIALHVGLFWLTGALVLSTRSLFIAYAQFDRLA